MYICGNEKVTISYRHGKHKHLRTCVSGGDFLRDTVQLVIGERKFSSNSVFKFPFAFTIPPHSPHTHAIACGHKEPEEDTSYCGMTRQKKHSGQSRLLLPRRLPCRRAALLTSRIASRSLLLQRRLRSLMRFVPSLMCVVYLLPICWLKLQSWSIPCIHISLHQIRIVDHSWRKRK